MNLEVNLSKVTDFKTKILPWLCSKVQNLSEQNLLQWFNPNQWQSQTYSTKTKPNPLFWRKAKPCTNRNLQKTDCHPLFCVRKSHPQYLCYTKNILTCIINQLSHLTHRNKEKPHTSQNILDAVLNVPFLLLLAQAGNFLKAWHGTNLTVQSSTSSNTSEMNWNTGCEPGQASSPVSAGPHCCSCIWAEKRLLYQINPNDPGISENPIKKYLSLFLVISVDAD